MNRTEKTLSTKWFKVYRIFLLVLVLGLFGAQIGYHLIDTNYLISVPLAILYVYLMWKFWWPSYSRFIKNFRRISYDDENLYVEQKEGVEVVLSFDRIKDVQLISLDGIYKFESIDGEEYYCKPSAWYPLNYSKVDNELNEIRRLISKYKQKFWAESENFDGLPSNN